MTKPKLKISALKVARNDAGLWDLINNAKAKPLLLILTSEAYCAPCLALHPFLKPMAEQYSEVLTVKCNPDNIEDKSMEELGVDGVPTMLFIFKNEVIDQYDGFSGDIDNVHEFVKHNIAEWKKEHAN